jgi:hypothetical protein
MSRGGRLFWAAAIVLLVGLGLLAPRAEDPEATLAVRRYLAEMGFRVADGGEPPASGGTLVLLRDLREEGDARTLLRWVEDGGKLVVADPNSVLLGVLGAAPTGPIGLVGTTELEPRCLAPEVVGVGRAAVRASDIALRAADDAFVPCFPGGDGAFLLTRRYGDGRVTLLGGLSPLTNELLRNGDNAVLAAQVAAPGPEVVFGAPVPPGAPASGGVWDFLPEGARLLVVATILAGIAFALVRARRLGAPVLEEPVAPIPASELVRATARMYRRAGAVAYCGTLLRQASAARFMKRLWAARGDDLPRMVARTSGLPEERVASILHGPEPRTDEALIELGLELEELSARARQGAT